MKTEKQIRNAYDRAAAQGHSVTSADQVTYFAAPAVKLADERGAVQCAAGFAAQALAKLENGDLDGFLASMRLAGTFANDASVSYYARRQP